MSVSDDIKLFGMHNLLLETDLKKLEESGIQIAHARTIQRAEIVDVDLFESDILQEARKMADFYALYYSLENSIRRLISERLSEKHGPNWWKDKVPDGVQKEVDKKRRDEKDTTMSIRSEDPLATRISANSLASSIRIGAISPTPYAAKRRCKPSFHNLTGFGMSSPTAAL
jgi:energy-converting hydrogenase A subunit M